MCNESFNTICKNFAKAKIKQKKKVSYSSMMFSSLFHVESQINKHFSRQNQGFCNENLQFYCLLLPCLFLSTTAFINPRNFVVKELEKKVVRYQMGGFHFCFISRQFSFNFQSFKFLGNLKLVFIFDTQITIILVLETNKHATHTHKHEEI